MPGRDVLLPDTSTEFEAALATPSFEALQALDPAILKALKDPWTCPAAFLPFLAEEFSVDVWDDDWPEEKQRTVIAESWGLHRIKGTLAAIRRFVGYVDASVVRAIVPPQDGYFGEDGATGWEESLPEVRIYPAAPLRSWPWSLSSRRSSRRRSIALRARRRRWPGRSALREGFPPTRSRRPRRSSRPAAARSRAPRWRR
ncbi:MAG: phage tail protein I, partial [Pseudomonadota bacterium]